MLLRPVDALLIALGRYGSWSRGWIVYRALAVLSVHERPHAKR